MTDFRDKLKESQQSEQGNYPRLDIALRVEPKQNAEGKMVFTTYDKEKQEIIEVSSPITGIFIGAAMQCSSFSSELGPNGGQYQSGYYLPKSEIALFAPTAKGYQMVCKGAIKDIEAYLSAQGAPGAKKRQVVFVLGPKGLIAVSTNLSIAIDQISRQKDELLEKTIVLTPKLFEEEDPDISQKGKNFLGKFRNTNPPKFATISVGPDITQNLFDNLGTEAVIDSYGSWREYLLAGVEDHGAVEEDTTEAEITSPADNYPAKPQPRGGKPAGGRATQQTIDDLHGGKNVKEPAPIVSEADSDLPF